MLVLFAADISVKTIEYVWGIHGLKSIEQNKWESKITLPKKLSS